MRIERYRPFLLLCALIQYLLRRELKYFYLNLDSFNRSSPRGCSTCSRPLTPQIPLAVHCRAAAFHFTWDGLRFLSALLWEAITVRLVDYDYSFWKYTVNRNLRSRTLKGFICEWSVRRTIIPDPGQLQLTSCSTFSLCICRNKFSDGWRNEIRK